uniref:ATP synthase subunit a n=1 Tax=Laevapex fuscus TaxID=240816 RepID=A0A8F8AHI3_9GAST|nr:ATP synthase F0 subunit 6 [Laevapex fuscus]
MFTDLFSALDNSQNSIYPWMLSTLMILLFTKNLFLKNFMFSINMEKNKVLPWNFINSLIIMLILLNLLGLIPFGFSITSSIWVNSAVALVFWMMLIWSGMKSSAKKTIAHLAPMGAPVALMPFLVLIETVSILIRPLTLTVRLVANIGAGHIVLSMISSCLNSFSISMFLVMMTYNFFEVFVCFVQAYVFTLLLKSYSNEVDY